MYGSKYKLGDWSSDGGRTSIFSRYHAIENYSHFVNSLVYSNKLTTLDDFDTNIRIVIAGHFGLSLLEIGVTVWSTVSKPRAETYDIAEIINYIIQFRIRKI